MALTAQLVVSSSALAQSQQTQGEVPEAGKPAPRWPDGRPNFGSPPGEVGLWMPVGGLLDVTFAYPDDAPPRPGRGILPGLRPRLSEVPFQPWARALYDYHKQTEFAFEPAARCKPSGGARQFLTPYGLEIVDVPELKRIFTLGVGGPHSYRIIYMDGRGHPKDLEPSAYGHSIGHWEGDALVIDTVGLNERFWIGRVDGTPHTEQLHFIERVTRVNMSTMKYEVVIDDHGAYTATWKSGFTLRWTPGTELFEFICQENNISPELMIDAEGRRSRIVP